MASPFDELLVIELATVLAGPSVGLFFAELGATVIKVESPQNPDVTRTWKLPYECQSSKVSAYFAGINYGKHFQKIDLQSDSGQHEFHKLAQSADILIVNFKPGDAEKLNCTYDQLAKLNRRLIYAALTGYGFSDNRLGYDTLLQAACGFMHLNREPAAAPQKMPIAMIDLLAAHQLKEAILTALYVREKTGIGTFVQTSLFASGLTALANQAAAYLWTGVEPQPIGSEHPSIVPYGTVFYDKNQDPLCLAIGNDKQFVALCEALNLPHLHNDERFKTNPVRVSNRAVLMPILQEAIADCLRSELLAQLSSRQVPAEAVCSISEAINSKLSQDMLVKVGENMLLHSVAFETVPPTWLRSTYSPPE